MRLHGCTHNGSTQEEWKTTNLYKFQKLNVIAKKDPYPLPFTNEILNTIARDEAYSFFDMYS
jgi:hypothetical protein